MFIGRYFEELVRMLYGGCHLIRDFQEINYPNKRTTETRQRGLLPKGEASAKGVSPMSDCRTENTERGGIERVFASVLEHFFIWKSLIRHLVKKDVETCYPSEAIAQRLVEKPNLILCLYRGSG
jgi:hypothetical protein